MLPKFAMLYCPDPSMQAREERRHAQAAVAANAKTLLRKETEWMRRQPKVSLFLPLSRHVWGCIQSIPA